MKYIFVIIGTLSLILGLIGVILPILPTTPFILLAAFMYLHGSKRLHRWLTTHPILGVYISDYFQHGGIRRKAKRNALIWLWASLGLSMMLVGTWPLRALLALIGAGVTWHILTIKTLEG